MACLFNGKNTLTQPTNTNDTPTLRKSNDRDPPSKDVSDALFAPLSSGSSTGLDCELVCPPFEHGSGLPTFFDIQAIGSEYSRNATSSSVLKSIDCHPPSPRTSGDVYDLLEDDFLFKVAARSVTASSSFSWVRRGLDTNLAELQIAGDVLHSPSVFLEEEWSRLSTPALSITSDVSSEASPPTPVTPPNGHYIVPAEIVVASDRSTSPAAETSTLQEPGPSEDSEALDLQRSSDEDERELASSGRKRKRGARDVSDTSGGSPEASSEDDGEKWRKWFRIEGRSKPRHSPRAEVTTYTKYGESCRSYVGDAGYCQFQWHRDGKATKCGIELIRDRDILSAHFALHFEQLGYYTTVASDPEWRPRCPWCHEEPTTFDNFLRHVNYTELQLNLARCGCGGSVSRGNQPRFRERHEATEKHREWVLRSRTGTTADSADEPDEEQEVFEGSGRGTKRRRLKAKGTQAAEEEDAHEESGEFVEGSSTGTMRKRSSSRRVKSFVKEEPDEEQERIRGSSTGAARKRRKAKKTKAAANEDPEEGEEEFVEGSSTGAKRRRLR